MHSPKGIEHSGNMFEQTNCRDQPQLLVECCEKYKYKKYKYMQIGCSDLRLFGAGFDPSAASCMADGVVVVRSA